jgi:hypothetical protein
VKVPLEVRHILEKDCYSCHSDQQRLSLFDQIVPAYWLARYDILTARKYHGHQLGAHRTVTVCGFVNESRLRFMHRYSRFAKSGSFPSAFTAAQPF